MRQVGSPSIDQPDYWWYRARADLLEAALGGYAVDARLVLDIGSADGPSVGWLAGKERKVALDLDPRGLEPGDVCGSALALPFENEVFDVVAAFDVIEHCEPESTALAEVARVLTPGGHLLMSVPAYQWAWSSFDVWNHHHRRYTRKRAVAAVERAGLVVRRSTYAFAGTFPMFAADRVLRRITDRRKEVRELLPGQTPPLPDVSATVDKLLYSLTRLDHGWFEAGKRLPFGSSVLVAAEKPAVLLSTK